MQVFHQGADVAAAGDDALELLARDGAQGAGLPQQVDGQGDQGADPQRTADPLRVLAVVLHQARHVAVVTEGSQAERQGRQQVGPVDRVRLAAVEQDRRLDAPEQAADGEAERNDHAAEHQRGDAVHRAGAPPHHQRHRQGEQQPGELFRQGHAEAAGQGVADDRAAAGDIGIGEDIEDEGDAQPVDHIPALAEQVTGDGREARAHRVVEVGLEDHHPRQQHAEPGEQEHRHRPAEPDAGHGDGQENIPAPTAVPAMIIEPPSSEGRRLGVWLERTTPGLPDSQRLRRDAPLGRGGILGGARAGRTLAGRTAGRRGNRCR